MNRAERRRALKRINTPSKFTEAMSEGLMMQRKDMQEQFEKQKANIIGCIDLTAIKTILTKEQMEANCFRV